PAAPDSCVRTAEGLGPGMFDVLDYAIRTAPNLRVALERLARYNRIEDDAAGFPILHRRHLPRVVAQPGRGSGRAERARGRVPAGGAGGGRWPAHRYAPSAARGRVPARAAGVGGGA